MKQLEVTILGQSYILACPEGHETELLEAVGQVDREMSTIRDAGKVKARERIAVLAALNLAYEFTQQRTRADAAAAAPQPAAALPPPGAAEAGLEGMDIDALVRRMDAALGHDGQLL